MFIFLLRVPHIQMLVPLLLSSISLSFSLTFFISSVLSLRFSQSDLLIHCFIPKGYLFFCISCVVCFFQLRLSSGSGLNYR